MNQPLLLFRVHALERMFQRHISEEDVKTVLANGEVIENYPQDLPYPSRLILGFCDNRPIHVVAADTPDQRYTIIITVYTPDPSQWDPTFRRRIMQ